MKKITYLFIAVFISITAFAQTEITDDLNFTGTGHEIKKALIETVASLGAETPTAGRFVRLSNGSVYVGNGSSWDRAVFVLGSPTLGTITAGTAQAQILKATGDGASNGIFIGTDTQLYRSAANVLNTPDSIIGQATGTIYGNLILGNENTKKIAFDGKDNYRILNVVSYNSAGTSITNKMAKITLPVITSSYLMFTLTVRGYRYAAGVWEAEIGVYTYNDGNYDVGCVCYTKGYCPFNIVKLGNEGGHPVVILGSTTSVFGDTAITADIVTYYAFYPELVAWLGDYTLDFVADISGVSDITTITAQYLPNINSNGLVVGTNKLSLTSGYVLDVSGAAYVSGTIYGAGTISGGTLVDRTDASKENALEDVRKWKVVGETIDHDSLGDCAVDVKEIKTGYEIKDKAGNIYNTLEEKVVPVKGSKETDIQALSEMAEQLKAGVAELSAQYQVKEVTKVVESKGRNISKTVSTLSRAIQQLSERLDALESSGIKSEANSLLQNK